MLTRCVFLLLSLELAQHDRDDEAATILGGAMAEARSVHRTKACRCGLLVYMSLTSLRSPLPFCRSPEKLKAGLYAIQVFGTTTMEQLNGEAAEDDDDME